MKLYTYLQEASNRLAAAGYTNTVFEARALITQVLAMSHETFVSDAHALLLEQDCKRLDAALIRRCQGEPLAKIVGEKEFWGLLFKVNGDTLDPRPDSETLIEAVLEALPHQDSAYRILELGTGSGCLILSLLSIYGNAQGVAIDISPKALEIAAQNAQRLGLSGRCQFKQNNWLENMCGEFDIIISNPPYIPAGDLTHLDPALRYDPQIALTPGVTGLESYQAIVPRIALHMGPHTKAFFEMGHDQAPAVRKILQHHGLRVQRCHQDLAEKERVIEFSI